jgi:excisionase family DNA binding protein
MNHRTTVRTTPPPPPPRRRYETIQAAAERTGVSTRTVRRWMAQGLIMGYRMGPRLVRLDADEIDRRMKAIPTAGGDAA